MVALQIRDVPEAIRDELADQARSQGKSLQSFLLALVEEQARLTDNRELLRHFAGRADGARLEEGDDPEEFSALREERERER